MRGTGRRRHDAPVTHTNERDARNASIDELIAIGRDREAIDAATHRPVGDGGAPRDGDTVASEVEAPVNTSQLEQLVGPTGRSFPQQGDPTMTATLTPEDLDAIKGRQQKTWASGDYAVIGTTLQIVGESLCEAVDAAAGSRVLDVAAGNGNASLAAARRGCEVTATDYVEELLGGARRRADADGLKLETRVADAENLPFADGEFDAVLSTFGVMFVPDPERAAAELIRVCRPGGRIGLANWTPTGFIGRMFKIVGAHVPPPAGVPSPLLWGTEDRLTELFGAHARVEVTRRHFVFRYRSADAFFDTFKDYYGPTLRAWDALDDAGRQSFRTQLTALADECNRDTRGALAVPSEYLEVVAHRTG
jgi:SAM-dependent methyltransferase